MGKDKNKSPWDFIGFFFFFSFLIFFFPFIMDFFF